jgi:cell division protein FtsL
MKAEGESEEGGNAEALAAEKSRVEDEFSRLSAQLKTLNMQSFARSRLNMKRSQMKDQHDSFTIR